MIIFCQKEKIKTEEKEVEIMIKKTLILYIFLDMITNQKKLSKMINKAILTNIVALNKAIFLKI